MTEQEMEALADKLSFGDEVVRARILAAFKRVAASSFNAGVDECKRAIADKGYWSMAGQHEFPANLCERVNRTLETFKKPVPA